MKKLITSAGIAALAAAALAPTAAFAEDSSLAFNVGVVSDYRYRGISQTRLKPAVQGGVDYSYGAFYVGAWASNIKWIKDAGASKGSVELDLYGGYKGAFAEGLSYDVGVLTYQYLGNKYSEVTNTNANTTEVYGALTFGPATFKLSYALTDTFGNPDSSGSYYADLSAGFDVGAGFILTPHLGYQKIDNSTYAGSYMDYSLSVSKEIVPGLSVSLAYVGTNANEGFYTTIPSADSKYLGKKAGVLGLKYTF